MTAIDRLLVARDSTSQVLGDSVKYRNKRSKREYLFHFNTFNGLQCQIVLVATSVNRWIRAKRVRAIQLPFSSVILADRLGGK